MFFVNSFKAYLLRVLTRKKSTIFDLRNTKKVLFFRYDRIGDMIITTPVFRELKLFLPQVEISVLASKINQSVLKNNPYVDHIFINHKNNFFIDFKTLFYLRKKKFDVCIEFDHSVVPHAILRLKVINPKVVISVDKKGRYGVSGGNLKLYDYYTKKKKNSHFRDIWLETLSPLGIKPKSNKYDLFCSEFQNDKAKRFVNNFYDKFLIGINLEGAVRGKKIKFSELFQICQGLYQNDKNIQIIILSSPNKFQILKEKVKKMSLDYVVISHKTESILDVAALIKKLDLIITPDTSIVHIASAFNKPIVSIHENNLASYKLFAPKSTLNRTVFSKSMYSLDGFSINSLLSHCFEIINLKRK
jgi:ADP-heptose:LPS heptosyltransferase